jgi:hypothetical protein
MTRGLAVRTARSAQGLDDLRPVSSRLKDVLVWAPLPQPVRLNLTRTAVLADDRAASAMLRRRRAEAWR